MQSQATKVDAPNLSEAVRITERAGAIRYNLQEISHQVRALRRNTFGNEPEKEENKNDKLKSNGFIETVHHEMEGSEDSINQILSDLAVLNKLY